MLPAYFTETIKENDLADKLNEYLEKGYVVKYKKQKGPFLEITFENKVVLQRKIKRATYHI